MYVENGCVKDRERWFELDEEACLSWPAPPPPKGATRPTRVHPRHPPTPHQRQLFCGWVREGKIVVFTIVFPSLISARTP
jgi:hypothetical protein